MSQRVVLCEAGFLGSSPRLIQSRFGVHWGSTLPRPCSPQQEARSTTTNLCSGHLSFSRKSPPSIKDYTGLGSQPPLPPHPAGVTDSQSLNAAFKDADVVVSLVGLMRGTRGQFAMEGLIGADVDSAIPYWRIKALGERAIFSYCPGATVFRRSITFGPGDGFFTRFTSLANILPFMPVFGGGTTRFQPVFVGDLAHAIKAIIELPETVIQVAREIIEAGGPDS